MRAAFYGLLRDDAIRTGGAAALLLRYTRYRGTGRGKEEGRDKEEKSKRLPPAQEAGTRSRRPTRGNDSIECVLTDPS